MAFVPEDMKPWLEKLKTVAYPAGDGEGLLEPDVALLVVEVAVREYKSLLAAWLQLFDVLPDAERPKVLKAVRELAEKTRATLGGGSIYCV